MSKVVLNPLTSLEAQTAFLTTLNDNFDKIELGFENTFSLDGTVPNALQAPLDVNSQRVFNLPAPIGANDPARLIDLSNAIVITGTLVPSLSGNAGKVLGTDGMVLTFVTPAVGDLQANLNLSDLTDKAVARTNLELGTAAQATVGTSGANVPLLSGNNTFSGTTAFTNTISTTRTITTSSTADIILNGVPTTLTDKSVGYRGAPVATHNADYTFLLRDAGCAMYHTSATAHDWIVQSNASISFPVGTVILLRNEGTGNVNIIRAGTVVMRRAGSATDANSVLSQWGFATLLKVDVNTWVISGTGVT